ncbi:MAG: hypothetical protein IJ916_06880 [Paludibacteraceae bacterium]|nr:hypothetical protein [Paludibacteraceae bacterium]
MIRFVFSDYKYVSLENLETRMFAQNDPMGFIQTYPNHTIIDEVQRVPHLLSYLQTHCDLRQLHNIGDLSKFVKCMKLCAGRIGQLLNLSSIANECGCSVPTVSSWISMLETSFIVYLLRPD